MNALIERVFEGLNEDQARVVRAIDHDVLVNAGAGTGKTHTLTRRYAYLLLKEPIAPDEPNPAPRNILAITYTDAAAEELRARIQDQLRVFAQDATLPDCEARKLASYARAMDQAWISTIHAFCARIIRSHAFELELDPNFSHLDAIQATNLQAEVLDGFEREIRIPAMTDTPLLLEASQFEGLTDTQANQRISQASDETIYATLVLMGLSKSALREGIQDIRASGVRHGKTLDQVESQSLDLAIDEVHRSDTLKAKLTIELARRFEARYREEKTKRGVLDFDDLIVKAHELLTGNEAVREGYRQRFDYIMVDEFQDTNPLTFEIVQAISTNNLCLVGDGKQAIFGFTGADVSLISYLTDAWSKDPAREVIPLSVNYRSTQPVLDFANAFCSHELMLGASRMQTLAKGRAVKQDDIANKISLPPVSIVGIGRGDSADAESKNYAEATVIARHFAELNEMGVPPADMTVLVRTHAHGEMMLDVLEQHGLQGTIVGGKSFYREMVVTELLDVLRLVRNPHDDQAFIRVALSAIGNLSDHTLETLGALTHRMGKDEVAPAASLFEAARLFAHSAAEACEDRRNARHLVEVFDRAVIMTGRQPIREIVTSIYRDRGVFDWWEQRAYHAERDRANFRKFLRIADALSQDDMSIIDLIQKIERAQDDEQDEGIGLWLEKENDERVRIMTLHNAKGQQFPVVAYFGGLQNARSVNGSFAYYNDARADIRALFERTLAHPEQKHADEARRQWAHHEPGSILYLANSTDCAHKRAALRAMYRNAQFEREFDETIRLFYVAATRAKDHLLITFQATDKEPNYPARKLGYTLTSVADDKDADIPAELRFLSVNEIDYPAVVEGQPDTALTLFESSSTAHYRPKNQLVQVSASQIRTFHQCPWRYWWTYANRLSVESDAARTGDDAEAHAQIGAAQKGTVIHQLLELITDDQTLQNLSEQEMERILDEQGISKDQQQPIIAAVDAYRNHDLFAEVRSHDIIHTEYQFYTMLASYYLYGFIDVLALDGEGNALIVDYKVSDSQATDISETYGKQARLYAYVALEQGVRSARVVFAQIKDTEIIVHEEKNRRVYTAEEIDELRAEILSDIEAMQNVPVQQPAQHREGLCAYCPVPSTLCSHREAPIGNQHPGCDR